MLEFLTLHPPVFGLDISDLSLKFVYLKKAGDRIEVVSFGESALPEGVVSKGEILKEDELAPLIKKSLEQAKGEKIRTQYVAASLPEEKAFLQVIQLPRMGLQELQQAALFEAENYVPYPLETVYVDSQFVEPVKDHLDHSDVLLASLPRATVDSYVSVLQKAGLVPQVLEIESLAVARALVLQEFSLFPVLLIDFGATRTSFLVFAGKSLRFTASLPVGSHQLTLAVSKALNLDIQKAEELKKTYGLERRGKSEGGKVFEALVPSLVDLAEQIKKYIDYYASHAAHQHLLQEERSIQKVLLAGGGANLPGLPQFLEQELNAEVHIGDPWVNIMSKQGGALPPIPFGESLRYTTALGLALRGFSMSYD